MMLLDPNLIEEIEAERAGFLDELQDVACPESVLERFGRLKQDREAGANDFINCAQGFLSFGMADEAIVAFTIAIERDADCGAAYLGRADVGFALCLVTEEETDRLRRSTQVIEDFRRSF